MKRVIAVLASLSAGAAIAQTQGVSKGEIVIVVGPPGEAEPPSEADMDAALREAMQSLSPSRAAAEVAARLGLPKRAVYERAQQLK